MIWASSSDTSTGTPLIDVEHNTCQGVQALWLKDNTASVLLIVGWIGWASRTIVHFTATDAGAPTLCVDVYCLSSYLLFKSNAFYAEQNKKYDVMSARRMEPQRRQQKSSALNWGSMGVTTGGSFLFFCFLSLHTLPLATKSHCSPHTTNKCDVGRRKPLLWPQFCAAHKSLLLLLLRPPIQNANRWKTEFKTYIPSNYCQPASQPVKQESRDEENPHRQSEFSNFRLESNFPPFLAAYTVYKCDACNPRNRIALLMQKRWLQLCAVNDLSAILFSRNKSLNFELNFSVGGWALTDRSTVFYSAPNASFTYY